MLQSRFEGQLTHAERRLVYYGYPVERKQTGKRDREKDRHTQKERCQGRKRERQQTHVEFEESIIQITELLLIEDICDRIWKSIITAKNRDFCMHAIFFFLMFLTKFFLLKKKKKNKQGRPVKETFRDAIESREVYAGIEQANVEVGGR